MSDNYIRIIPIDPKWIPGDDKKADIEDGITDLFPNAQEVKLVHDEGVQFRDCGSNLEKINCPKCNAEISIDNWQELVDLDYSEVRQEFKLDPIILDCCGYKCSINDLKYDFDQGFSTVEISVMNPRVGNITAGFQTEIESIIGCKVKIIFQHI